MSRISEIDRPGLALRIAHRIGRRMFGAMPTPAKAPIAWDSWWRWAACSHLERGGLLTDAPLRAPLHVHVPRPVAPPARPRYPCAGFPHRAYAGFRTGEDAHGSRAQG